MNGLIIVFVFREEWGTAPGGVLPYTGRAVFGGIIFSVNS